jgi:hypothetical protein
LPHWARNSGSSHAFHAALRQPPRQPIRLRIPPFDEPSVFSCAQLGVITDFWRVRPGGGLQCYYPANIHGVDAGDLEFN